jgi:hypothetical protein
MDETERGQAKNKKGRGERKKIRVKGIQTKLREKREKGRPFNGNK